MSDDEDFSEDAETDAEGEEGGDAFDAQRALVAQSLEVSKLKQHIEVLKRANERIREQYKQEVRTLLQPLIEKHRKLQAENTKLSEKLERYAVAPPGTDEAVVEELRKLRHDHAVLQKIAEGLEADSRLARRLQAELEEAQKQIEGLESRTSELEREKRRLEAMVAERDQDRQVLEESLETARAEATDGREKLDKVQKDHKDELKEYQQQLGEAVAKLYAFERHNKEAAIATDVLPMLFEELQAELATYDELASYFSATSEPLPEPSVAALGLSDELVIGGSLAVMEQARQGANDSVDIIDMAAPAPEAVADTDMSTAFGDLGFDDVPTASNDLIEFDEDSSTAIEAFALNDDDLTLDDEMVLELPTYEPAAELTLDDEMLHELPTYEPAAELALDDEMVHELPTYEPAAELTLDDEMVHELPTYELAGELTLDDEMVHELPTYEPAAELNLDDEMVHELPTYEPAAELNFDDEMVHELPTYEPAAELNLDDEMVHELPTYEPAAELNFDDEMVHELPTYVPAEELTLDDEMVHELPTYEPAEELTLDDEMVHELPTYEPASELTLDDEMGHELPTYEPAAELALDDEMVHELPTYEPASEPVDFNGAEPATSAMPPVPADGPSWLSGAEPAERPKPQGPQGSPPSWLTGQEPIERSKPQGPQGTPPSWLTGQEPVERPKPQGPQGTAPSWLTEQPMGDADESADFSSQLAQSLSGIGADGEEAVEVVWEEPPVETVETGIEFAPGALPVADEEESWAAAMANHVESQGNVIEPQHFDDDLDETTIDALGQGIDDGLTDPGFRLETPKLD